MVNSDLFQAIFDQCSTGIVAISNAGSIVAANPFACHLFGYGSDELIGKDLSILVPESAKKNHLEDRQRYFDQPQARPMGTGLELMGLRKDGTTFPAEISLGHQTIKGQTMVYAFVSDNSKMVKKLTELAETKARFDKVQKVAGIGTFSWDLTTNQIHWSDGTFRIFGIEPQSLNLSPERLIQYVHPDDRLQVQNDLQQLKDGKGNRIMEYRIIKPDGSVRFLKGVKDITVDSTSESSEVIGLIQDVTDLHEKEVSDHVISEVGTPIAFADLTGKITEINNAFITLWGYDHKNEVIGLNMAELNGSKEQAGEIIQSLQQLGEWTGESKAIKKDGTSFNIIVSAKINRTAAGDPVNIFASLVDISPLKRAEKDRADVAKIVEESLNEIYIFDAETLKFMQVNKGARKNIGYHLNELKELTPIDIKPEFTADSFQKLVQPLVDGTQEKIQFQTIHRRKNGSQYPVDIHLQKSRFNQRPVFAAIILDITKQRNTEKLLTDANENLERKIEERTAELHLNEAKLKEVNRLAKIGHWELDLVKGGPINWSDEYIQLFDLSEKPDPRNHRYFLPFVHEGDRDRIIEISQQALQSRENASFDFGITTASGTRKYLHAELYCIKNVDGQVIKLFSVVQDVTDREQSKINLRNALKKERELGELKSRFVSMASHEFRTPLTSILSSVDLIRLHGDRGNLAGQQKHISRVKSSVRNLTMILDDFLSLEKLESGVIQLHPKPTQFVDFIADLIEEVSLIAKEGQEILHDHQGDPNVEIDEQLLKNILLNLLSNAIKYSSTNKSITIQSGKKKNFLFIHVIDQGIGIPHKEQQEMFTRFFRASNAANIQGTGLGLTIVKRYVDLMDGSISFTSEPNEGSTFTLELPQKSFMDVVKMPQDK